jgi:2-polyprenyl-6-methoxyphenol hydroxylase-like FAD-dependent oxidoreductase
MADHGARVLVLEREPQFKDRIRGELLLPWGGAEARALGIYELLRDTCGHEVPWFDTYLGAMPTGHNNLPAITPQQAPSLTFYHPTMQEVLLQAATNAGAEVRRGATVREVRPGTTPMVVVEQNGQIQEIPAWLIVGADGRSSLVRKWAGFTVQRDPDRILIAATLFENMQIAQDTIPMFHHPSIGRMTILVPQGHGRVRVYFCYHKDTNLNRLQGADDIARFIEESIKAGAVAEWYSGARATGPLATFDGADTWVPHPYRDGIALLGDAAASNDPSLGQGTCLTLRDVRVLRDKLCTFEDWNIAGHAYAEEHDRHYGVMHNVGNWFNDLFLVPGPEAEACRARAFPLLAQDPTRFLSHIFIGPDLPLNETVRRRFFGEE